MRGRSFILRFAAFFLLLVFAQKSGAGLLLHNVLHTSQITDNAPDNKEINVACNCIDDFLMPFAEPDEVVVSVVVVKHETPVSYFTENVPFHKSIQASLRGPPADIL